MFCFALFCFPSVTASVWSGIWWFYQVDIPRGCVLVLRGREKRLAGDILTGLGCVRGHQQGLSLLPGRWIAPFASMTHYRSGFCLGWNSGSKMISGVCSSLMCLLFSSSPGTLCIMMTSQVVRLCFWPTKKKTKVSGSSIQALSVPPQILGSYFCERPSFC